MHQFHDACAYKFCAFSLPHSNNPFKLLEEYSLHSSGTTRI